MFGDWRISTVNGVLLAAYFIPSWTISALKIYLGAQDSSTAQRRRGCRQAIFSAAMATVRHGALRRSELFHGGRVLLVFLLLIHPRFLAEGQLRRR